MSSLCPMEKTTHTAGDGVSEYLSRSWRAPSEWSESLGCLWFVLVVQL
jgi:hypothetical protein